MPTVHTWQYLEYIVEGEGDDQYITIYGYDSAENPEHPHVTIPAEIEHEGVDLPVKRVGVDDPELDMEEPEFIGAPFVNAGLTGITIPEGIESIGGAAFHGNDDLPGDKNNLGKLKTPDTLKRIETKQHPDEPSFYFGSFQEAGITGKLVIPNQMTEIKEFNFYENDIEELHLGKGLEGGNIKDRAFQRNRNLIKIITPDNVMVADNAFQDTNGDFKSDYEANNSQAGTYEWNETDEEWEKTGDYESPEEPEPPEVGVVGGYGGIRVGYRGLFGY